MVDNQPDFAAMRAEPDVAWYFDRFPILSKL